MRVKSLALAGTAVAVLGIGAATPAFAAAPEHGVSGRVECYGTVTQGSTTYGKVFVVHRHHHMVGGVRVTKTAKPGTYGIKGHCLMVPMRHKHWCPPHTATTTSLVTQTTVVPKGAAQTGFGGSQESNVPLTAAALSLLLAGGAGVGLLARRRFQARARS